MKTSGVQKQVYEQVLATIRKYRMVEPGDLIVIGVSGGVDSVVLLDILFHLRARLKIHLHVAHLNHQFRGEEAERDAEFVRSLAQTFDLPCTIESCDVPTRMRERKLSPQDAARQERYRFFQTLADSLQAQKIATAHHADDQAETVLLALLRGAGLHGLGGIQPVLHDQVIRPLLSVSRKQIESYAHAAELASVFDSSNASRKYLRNAIRLDLIPCLQQQFNPAVVKRLTEYAQLFQEDAFFIDKIAERHYSLLCEQDEKCVRIHLEQFAEQERTIQRAIVYKAYEELTGARYALETVHARAVIDLFIHKEVGKRLSLPKRVTAIRGYEWGTLCREHQPETRAFSQSSLVIPGRTKFGNLHIDTDIRENRLEEQPIEHLTGLRRTVGCINPGTPLMQHFDHDRITPPIIVRFRQPGDRFQPLGMSGRKRLKKFFIDRKVPQETRQYIPVLADQQGIIWVVGYSIDDRVKITEHTKKILTCNIRTKR